jgi:hypothetical protein
MEYRSSNHTVRPDSKGMVNLSMEGRPDGVQTYQQYVNDDGRILLVPVKPSLTKVEVVKDE